ncbi:uncharacterized protein [Halyomorpha halys]|uniref:uncharacterized protein n=1 Tax=Halyomorpha halys TaxID=286706 RepID=UPI0006D4CA8B|nr:uncharacterized protein LOC106689140 [Halyomorpha halys]XP_014289438.1 uncharacterized protein LOC106689140 [Halyomorpha halys]
MSIVFIVCMISIIIENVVPIPVEELEKMRRDFIGRKEDEFDDDKSYRYILKNRITLRRGQGMPWDSEGMVKREIRRLPMKIILRNSERSLFQDPKIGEEKGKSINSTFQKVLMKKYSETENDFNGMKKFRKEKNLDNISGNINQEPIIVGKHERASGGKEQITTDHKTPLQKVLVDTKTVDEISKGIVGPKEELTRNDTKFNKKREAKDYKESNSIFKNMGELKAIDNSDLVELRIPRSSDQAIEVRDKIIEDKLTRTLGLDESDKKYEDQKNVSPVQKVVPIATELRRLKGGGSGGNEDSEIRTQKDDTLTFNTSSRSSSGILKKLDEIKRAVSPASRNKISDNWGHMEKQEIEDDLDHTMRHLKYILSPNSFVYIENHMTVKGENWRDIVLNINGTTEKYSFGNNEENEIYGKILMVKIRKPDASPDSQVFVTYSKE